MPRSPNRVIANEAFLRLLCTARPSQRNQIIHTATKEQIRCIAECAYNVLRKNVQLSPAELRKLRKYRKFVYDLVRRDTSLSATKEQLEQSGGFLPALIGPIIASLAGVLTQKFVG